MPDDGRRSRLDSRRPLVGPAAGCARLSLPDQEEVDARVSTAADRVSRLRSAHGTALGTEVLGVWERVVEQLPRVLIRLQDPTAMSVVHDDVHVGNFLLPTSGGEARLVDWQTCTADLAVRDLAHMIAYVWFPSARRDLEEPLLRRYREEVASKNVDYAWEPCGMTIDSA